MGVWNTGAHWHRWDPHLHTPATVLNNQFGKDWDAYFSAIETAIPRVDAIGVTDYCVLRGYKDFLSRWKAGRAKNVSFVFPNVEFRLGLETKEGGAVNAHLLFSPEEQEHEKEIERVLRSLSFSYRGRNYQCTPDDLVALGRAVGGKTDEEAALQKGVEQFKVDWKELFNLVRSDAWARDNSLVAIATHGKDGLAGLNRDGSFEALREELKSFPHIMFSSNPSDREFWLGRKEGFPREFIETTYGGTKPCLHGSDAHRLEEVCRPLGNRYCWIRSELTFTGLKQTILEPDIRVAIGESPPPGTVDSECIRQIEVANSAWLETPSIELNEGLVAIIGPKGSGKTALADMIALAAGCSIQDQGSFLRKAESHVSEGTAQLLWKDGSHSNPCSLADLEQSGDGEPRVRYLSQQFVDRLCAADTIGEELLREIESVVFRALPEENRLDAATFRELRTSLLEQALRLREEHLQRVHDLTVRLAAEDEKKANRPALLTKLSDLVTRIEKDERDSKSLLPQDKKAEVARLTELQTAFSTKMKALQEAKLQLTKLRELIEDHRRLREQTAKAVDDLKNRYVVCGLSEAEWATLRLTMQPEAKPTLEAARARIEEVIRHLEENKTPAPGREKDLTAWSLKSLEDAIKHLTDALGVEKERGKKHQVLQARISSQKTERDKLQKEVDLTENVDTRRKDAIDARRKAYAEVFDTFVLEQQVLEELYAPLRKQLAGEGDTERKLEFYVRRRIDVESWAARGESYLDLRKSGVFQGRGRLAEMARKHLLSSWRDGGAQQVAEAMEHFIAECGESLVAGLADRNYLPELGRWLFSAEHVSLEYGIKYEGVDVAFLSPGMRGIVLLILYLAIDQWDTRPLLVDQPEENLDPQSVYQELVRYFREAKHRRQVIVVTHNPNLVVNGDADQVIVADMERPAVNT